MCVCMCVPAHACGLCVCSCVCARTGVGLWKDVCVFVLCAQHVCMCALWAVCVLWSSSWKDRLIIYRSKAVCECVFVSVCCPV